MTEREAIAKLARAIGALYDFSALYFKRAGDAFSDEISQACSRECDEIADEFSKPPEREANG